MLPSFLCKTCLYHVTAATLAVILSISTVIPNICIRSFVFFQSISFTAHVALVIVLSVLLNNFTSSQAPCFASVWYCQSDTNLIHFNLSRFVTLQKLGLVLLHNQDTAFSPTNCRVLISAIRFKSDFC